MGESLIWHMVYTGCDAFGVHMDCRRDAIGISTVTVSVERRVGAGTDPIFSRRTICGAVQSCMSVFVLWYDLYYGADVFGKGVHGA